MRYSEEAKALAAEALAAAKGLDESAFEGALAVHRLRTLGEWSGLARTWPVFCSRRLGQPFEFCSALLDNARRVERAAALAKHPLPDDPRLLWGLGALGAAVERGEGLFADPGPGASKWSPVETLAEAGRLREALAALRVQAEAVNLLGREAMNAGGIEAGDGSPGAVERAGRAKFEALFGSGVGTLARAALLAEALLGAR